MARKGSMGRFVPDEGEHGKVCTGGRGAWEGFY